MSETGESKTVTDRQTAAFLFTDLVGSTALSASVPPEHAQALRQEHFGLLRAVLARTEGVEVKNLGDGVMAVYGTASRALDGAVAIQQAIEARNRRAIGAADATLAVRIGISIGEANIEDGDYFGDPVLEAARLCAAAQGGQILATSVVAVMAGRHRAHPFTDLGEMELKGLPARVPVVEVGWEPVALEVGTCGPVPLPSRLDTTPASGFVGRNEQSQALEVAWKNVVQGGTHVVMISGEPGIGKTRLAREAATAAHTGGAIVLLGSCDEAVEAPFRPWIEALGHLVRHAPDEVISSLGPVRLGSLCLLLPDARERGGLDGPASSDPETERYQLFSAVVALLEAAAASAPVMLVLDDLHWADRASLVLLRHLVSAGPARAS